ncbi:Nif11-like leader peptide family RiPP precursor [Desulfovibrio sp. JC010]|uniref:Nif11-like leader peptide family RiPP precursor n=1 Tax=Desulfovibrio sp. JC010 TaxID=2593641 RepID=UPI0013D170B7|nr:Nif11-like leader peptide family RiPP precursor [Desulfovibrio sp. JC010]
MSAEAATQWVLKLHENEELRREAEAAGSFEDRQALARQHGFEFCKEEIEDAFKADDELSDDDLDAVAGGSIAMKEANKRAKTEAFIAAASSVAAAM